MKNSRTFLVWACFALVLAAFVWIGTLSRSYQKCATQDESRYSQNKQSDLHEPLMKRSRRVPLFLLCEGEFIDENSGTLTALATIAIAAFTLTLWRATTEQGRLTRESIDLGNREFAATHRPRIRIAYIKIEPLQAGQHPVGEIWAINVGDGEAEITELGLDVFWRRIDMAGTGVFHAPPSPYPSGPVMVGPGQQAIIRIRGGQALRQEIINGILGSPNIEQQPWLHLCVVGTIHYLDANRTHRLTSFFRIYNPDRLRFMRAPDDDEYAEWEYEA